MIGVSAVALGYGSELVAGVGLATWGAHPYAELLGRHVQHREPLQRGEVRRAVVDGSPILASTVLPASVLLLGRFDLMTDNTARIISILVATLQLLSIGVFVARVAPDRPVASWGFALVTAGIGIAVVALTVLLAIDLWKPDIPGSSNAMRTSGASAPATNIHRATIRRLTCK